jgi:hypothetical protein
LEFEHIWIALKIDILKGTTIIRINGKGKIKSDYESLDLGEILGRARERARI